MMTSQIPSSRVPGHVLVRYTADPTLLHHRYVYSQTKTFLEAATPSHEKVKERFSEFDEVAAWNGTVLPKGAKRKACYLDKDGRGKFTTAVLKSIEKRVISKKRAAAGADVALIAKKAAAEAAVRAKADRAETDEICNEVCEEVAHRRRRSKQSHSGHPESPSYDEAEHITGLRDVNGNSVVGPAAASYAIEKLTEGAWMTARCKALGERERSALAAAVRATASPDKPAAGARPKA
jgi:hypothetical protein